MDIRDPELPYIADYFHIMKREDIHFCKYPVSLQLCSYYVRMACVSALYGKDWKKNFKDAQKAYNRTDRGIWKKRMEEYLKNIEKSVSGEKADFSGKNCSIRGKS